MEFADSCGMIVHIVYFQKDVEKLITYKSGGNVTLFFSTLFKKEILTHIKDIKAIPGNECPTASLTGSSLIKSKASQI